MCKFIKKNYLIWYTVPAKHKIHGTEAETCVIQRLSALRETIKQTHFGIQYSMRSHGQKVYKLETEDARNRYVEIHKYLGFGQIGQREDKGG